MNTQISHRSDVDANLLDIATKTKLDQAMPTHSEKKRTEFALASAAENVGLATAFGSADEGDESSGMSLVENLTLFFEVRECLGGESASGIDYRYCSVKRISTFFAPTK